METENNKFEKIRKKIKISLQTKTKNKLNLVIFIIFFGKNFVLKKKNLILQKFN